MTRIPSIEISHPMEQQIANPINLVFHEHLKALLI
jgi:hypothetical protein